MADEPKPFYEIKLNDIGESFEFRTAQDLLTWSDRQRSVWQPTLDIKSKEVPDPLRGAVDQVRSHLRGLFDTAKSYSEKSAPELRGQLDQHFRSTFVQSGVPVSPDSFIAFINKLRETNGGNLSAWAAFASLGREQKLDVRIPQVRLGMTAAMLFQLGVDPSTPAANAVGLKALTEEYEKGLLALAEQKRAAEAAVTDILKKLSDDAAEQRKTDKLDVDATIAKVEEEGKAAIASIKAVEAAYTGQMQLQASVKYWEDEAGRYKWRSRVYLLGTILYVLATGYLAFEAANKYIPLLLNVPSEKGTVVVGLTATITLLTATVAFWIGRVLVRLYLSSHHLFVDGRERAVMIKTFLALVKEDKLAASERTLVLSPLFRPSSDGIVKEDTAPDLGIAAQVARYLDRKPG